MRHRATIFASILAAVVVAGLAVWAFASRDHEGGGGGPGAGDPPSAAVDYEAALADAPPALAKMYAKGDALIPGGPEAFAQQLQALDGHPVVVNVWASWCGPCRAEFPYFQSVSAERGDRIAFLGVDSQDFDDAAGAFLEDFPLPYPSITDPDGEIQADLGVRGLPATAFYDRQGELVHLKQGPYESEAELAADIERYTG